MLIVACGLAVTMVPARGYAADDVAFLRASGQPVTRTSERYELREQAEPTEARTLRSASFLLIPSDAPEDVVEPTLVVSAAEHALARAAPQTSVATRVGKPTVAPDGESRSRETDRAIVSTTVDRLVPVGHPASPDRASVRRSDASDVPTDVGAPMRTRSLLRGLKRRPMMEVFIPCEPAASAEPWGLLTAHAVPDASARLPCHNDTAGSQGMAFSLASIGGLLLLPSLRRRRARLTREHHGFVTVALHATARGRQRRKVRDGTTLTDNESACRVHRKTPLRCQRARDPSSGKRNVTAKTSRYSDR